MDKILKVFRAEIKEVNEKDFTLTAIVSTKKQDRDGDIVLPEAVEKRLKIYKEHPVLLSSHNYSKLTNQIGEAQSVKVTENGIEVKFKYYVGLGNPEADWAWVLAQKGVASFSIGFIGHAFDWIEEKQEDGTVRTIGRKFTDIELIEVSQVLVPSNRQALQMGRSFAQEEMELCEIALKSFGESDYPKQKESLGKESVYKEQQEVKVMKGAYCGIVGKVLKYHKEEDLYSVVMEDGVRLVLAEADLQVKEGEHYSEKLLEKGESLTSHTEAEPIDIQAVKDTIKSVLTKENK